MRAYVSQRHPRGATCCAAIAGMMLVVASATAAAEPPSQAFPDWLGAFGIRLKQVVGSRGGARLGPYGIREDVTRGQFEDRNAFARRVDHEIASLDSILNATGDQLGTIRITAMLGDLVPLQDRSAGVALGWTADIPELVAGGQYRPPFAVSAGMLRGGIGGAASSVTGGGGSASMLYFDGAGLSVCFAAPPYGAERARAVHDEARVSIVCSLEAASRTAEPADLGHKRERAMRRASIGQDVDPGTLWQSSRAKKVAEALTNDQVDLHRQVVLMIRSATLLVDGKSVLLTPATDAWMDLRRDSAADARRAMRGGALR